MYSSDGSTRSLVSDIAGSGWDFNFSRHRYHEIERPFGPHYTVYNRRLMAVCFDEIDTVDGYWLLRQKAAVLHTGEFPIQFKGPDATKLLDKLFTKNITKLKPNRCGYGLACYEDGGLITDGVLLRLSEDLYWYVQADGDFYSWARAHATGMNVEISDPKVNVSQVQGPKALQILQAAAEDGMPEPFNYFGIATVNFDGQYVIVTRTGYTNELGFEFYTEPHHDADALWKHLSAAGEPYGMGLHGLDSMHIRRIEAGILNAGSDFNQHTTPFDVGLERFVDLDKSDFIGKSALENSTQQPRLIGLLCETAEPHIGADVVHNSQTIGVVTAGAMSPFMQSGIGIARLDTANFSEHDSVSIGCTDGQMHDGRLATLPLYDKQCDIPRGNLVDIPDRT
ncbi:MAG: aminomethyltransferase family protein [Gammaproteobacteria bacterium]|nr:aminomethyltransferase family protein [Gammaproteobacteria bacterium]